MGQVTLQALASHHSGLPRDLPTVSDAYLASTLTMGDPTAGVSPRALLFEAGTLALDGDGFRYSNVGMSLLGQAEARAAGVPTWSSLVRQRLLIPLGMQETNLADTGQSASSAPRPGTALNGWPVALLKGVGMQPAGVGVWSTSHDMALFGQALLTGRAPGSGATSPLDVGRPGTMIGMAWMSEGELIFHEGETLGYACVLILDRARQRAVFVVGDSPASVDSAALTLLPGARERLEHAEPGAWVLGAVAIGLLVVAVGVATLTLRWRNLVLRLVAVAVLAVAGFLAVALGPWQQAPRALYGALLGLGLGLILVRPVGQRGQAPRSARGKG